MSKEDSKSGTRAPNPSSPYYPGVGEGHVAMINKRRLLAEQRWEGDLGDSVG